MSLYRALCGISDPAIKPIALRLAYRIAQTVKIAVVGLAGIASGEDAAEFLVAGVSAVEIGTATFWDPRAPLFIARKLDRFLRDEGISNVREIVGALALASEVARTAGCAS